ncbi:MarR family winged helix-turn-helix transcriptional regulator [Alloyangia pacifica]|uniref:MarR family winged helix-turn-helix transcriptional regulator n=1 Tax=Alloyangia pacifica TaxID=311180 RepID=UPI001CD41CCC|nr:MarR family winged helix-turn-helix transcriptional regulator [Alloyangia pacifica]MCA0994495.1 MarR family winged helix-turn-helix transcriptional regulator [Alloyangia pacifica]
MSTARNSEGLTLPDKDARIRDHLRRAGIDDASAQAAIDIDVALQKWRRRVMKRELGERALADLGLSIDLAQLDVLLAVRAPEGEFEDARGEETMVSTVAARLRIDPSRASRIASDLIRMGLVRRAVSQKDARRTVLELTTSGAEIVSAVRSYKFLVLGSFLKDWDPEEIALFLPLLDRFSAWSDRAGQHSAPVAERIADLRAALAELPEPPEA